MISNQVNEDVLMDCESKMTVETGIRVDDAVGDQALDKCNARL